MNIGFVGLGFVGLTTAAVFASRGIKVTGYDIDPTKLKSIRNGIVPFYEPSLEETLRKAATDGFFGTDNDLEQLVAGCSIVFVTVGTPSREDGSIDLAHVLATAESIGNAIRKTGKTPAVVIKSTVIPGTARRVKEIISKSSGRGDVSVCSNPEFLREGSAVQDTQSPHLVVIGCDRDVSAESRLREFYEGLYRPHVPHIMTTSTATAEMIKYANNAFLATKISFINMIANICQRVEGCDVEVVAKAIGFDPRIGPLFLKAGAGYGGSCFPKDVKAFISFSESMQYEPLILASVDSTNKKQPLEVVAQAERVFASLAGKKIAVLGLAFKKDTDDLREAVSIPIINALLEKGARVQAYDPKAMPNARKIFGEKVTFCDSSLQCISGMDCCMVLTEWDEFRRLGPEDFKKNMKRPVVVDARRIFEPARFEEIVEFFAVGRSRT